MTTHSEPLVVHPIGWVESSLNDLAAAPKQGNEGAPDAWLVFNPDVAAGLRDLRIGTEILVLTWLDRGRRDVLTVHPRGDTTRDERGVFSTRSPNRPNPIGLHPVEIVSVDGTRLLVRNLEAIDGTPILDIKPLHAGQRPDAAASAAGHSVTRHDETAGISSQTRADGRGLNH